MLPAPDAVIRSGAKISVEGGCQTCYESIKKDRLFFSLSTCPTKPPVNTDYSSTF
jgi:hypothetical protein